MAPRTLQISALEQHAPSWRVPATAAPPPSTRLRITRRSSAAAAAAATAQGSGGGGSSSQGSGGGGRSSSENLTEQSCCICLETFAAGNSVRRLPCRHLFHATCIDEWLTTSSDICPECNQQVINEPSSRPGSR